jgi:hypothetical protein
MHGTDEVWVAGERGDSVSTSGILGMVRVLRLWSGFSFPKIEVLVA